MTNGVDTKHKERDGWLTKAELVEDVVEGEVKAKGEKYLPRPNPSDISRENQDRYAAYLLRAIFVNYVGRTLRGLVGAAFSKAPACVVPDDLKYVEKDIDGAGMSVYQQSQCVLGEGVMTAGMTCLFVDYPPAGPELSTVQARRTANIRAKTLVIEGEDVLNFRTEAVNGQVKLTLFTYKSDVSTPNGFTETITPQITALQLINGVYTVSNYRKADDKPNSPWVLVGEPRTPLDGDGRQWDVIPIIFVRADHNAPGYCDSPLYDMAEVSLGHWRNSADYEDSVYMCGQAQPWASGIDIAHYQALKAEKVMWGSRTLFPVPQGGQVGIAQAQPNLLVAAAMDKKEQQLVALGARIISKDSATKTATQAASDTQAEHSVLSLACSNVSDAYTLALQYMARYERVDPKDINYAINQEFTRAELTPQLLTAVTGLLNTGQWPLTDFWGWLRRVEMIDPAKNDETIKGEIEGQTTPSPDLGLGA
jgi:hypothetical protein